MTRPATSDSPDVQSLAAAAAAAAGKGPPPVHLWNPDFCGDIDMRIARDGTWFYLGTPIGRPAMVRLFASVLRRDEDGKHYLVTPVEKVGITVDAAPFLAVAVERIETERGPALRFRTNVDDEVVLDDEHPLRVEIDPATGEPAPYLLVRGRLEALISRAVFFELAELAQERPGPEGRPVLGLVSCGSFFALGPAE